MKALKCIFLLGLIAMGASWASAQSVDANYAECDPHCIVFKQIGAGYFAIAVNSTGEYVGLAAMEKRVGSILAASSMRLPVFSQPSLAQSQQITGGGQSGGCVTFDVKVSSDSYKTKTQIVTVITTKTYCDGNLISVDVSVVHVDIPGIEAPGPERAIIRFP